MFESNIIIKGKHAGYLKFLSEKTKLLGESNMKNGVNIFKRFVDTLMIAPLVGAIKGLRAPEDKESDDKAQILADQLIRESENLRFIYRLVILTDTSKGYDPDTKIKVVFKEEGDFDLFMDYVRGGIEYLYDFFTDGATLKADYYDRMGQLISDIEMEYNDNYEEILNKITK